MTGITDHALHEILLEMHSVTTETDPAPAEADRSTEEAPGAADPADAADQTDAAEPFLVVTRDMAFEFRDGDEPLPGMA